MRRHRAFTSFKSLGRRVTSPDNSSVSTEPRASDDGAPSRALEPLADSARADWSTIGTGGHGVQFYAEDDALIDLLARHVGSALVGLDAAVVLATPARHEALQHELLRRGFDLGVARRAGRYQALDAEEALAQVMVDGRPDRDRFRALAIPALERATAAAGSPRARVAAYGELVALLWAKGYPEAALRVEQFWNELASSHRFSLCCAYPMKGFAGQVDAAPFMKICAQHSHIFPVERRTRDRAGQQASR